MGDTWVERVLREKDEMTPSVGFNVVEIDNWRIPGDEVLLLVGHFESEIEAEAARTALEAQAKKAYVYGPRYTITNLEEELRHHGQKCVAHLARAQLALVLGRVAAQVAVPKEHEALIARAIGSHDDREHRILEALTRSLFLDLKANFELFLWSCCRACLRRDPVRALGRIEANPELKGFVRKAKETDLTRDDWEALLPAHSLDKLVPLLEIVAPGLGVKGIAGWSQVEVAFAVRHLVEHRNGRVDERFRRSVEHAWADSTWGRRSPEFPRRVEVLREDFDTTYEVMSDASLLVIEKAIEAASVT